MSQKKENNNVTVGVRIRPRNEKELSANMDVYFSPSDEGNDVLELSEEGDIVKNWSYDHVFGPSCSNSFIFETIGTKLIDAAIEGYNTVLFMYGQTSSGKTFTLFGGGSVAGLVQHSMEHVQKRVQSSNEMEFVIKLTYTELYNEELKDLLSPVPNENLKIIDDPNLGPVIQNVTEASFTSAEDVKNLLEEGEKRRHFGVTNMNAHSSRSHVLVRLTIESRKVAGKINNPLRKSWGKDKPSVISTLNLVDLAGSERADKSGTSGESLKEGSFINKSLLTLGTVISELSKGGKPAHIPYRNSKLTRLLASALGGNAKTCMITCISPASGNVAESLNTLRFASRAKRIVNHVQKNEILNAKTLVSKLALQNAEIEQLKSKLELSRQLGFSPDDQEKGETLKEKAVQASKNWRSLRFLMSNAPKIVRALKTEGMKHLAKKVQSDVKSAIAGNRELSEIIEEHNSMISTYLPKERKLLMKVQSLIEENETDMIVSDQDMHDEVSDDESGVNNTDDFDMDYGSEEIKEQLNQALMYNEDFRHLNIKMHKLFEDKQLALEKSEKGLKLNISELEGQLKDKEDTIRKIRKNEETISKQLGDLKSNFENESKSSKQLKDEMQIQMESLELRVDEAAKTISEKNHEIMTKDSEIEKLKTRTDQLSQELASAIQSRRALEEESARVRGEMRIQMDRLRNNMHEMLVQGGEEAKIIEHHNSQLQKELDTLNDSLEMTNRIKDGLEQQISQFRSEIAILREEQKARVEEITASRQEVSDLMQKSRELRFELTKVNSALTVSDQENQKLMTQLREQSINHEEVLDEIKKEMVEQKDKDASVIRKLKSEIEKLNSELESANDEIKIKSEMIQRFEQSNANEATRNEMKLSQMNDTIEDLNLENSTLKSTIHSLQTKHAEEMKQMRHKIFDLETIIDSANKYLEENTSGLNENNSILYFDDESVYVDMRRDSSIGSIEHLNSDMQSSRHNSVRYPDRRHSSTITYNDYSDIISGYEKGQRKRDSIITNASDRPEQEEKDQISTFTQQNSDLLSYKDGFEAINNIEYDISRVKNIMLSLQVATSLFEFCIQEDRLLRQYNFSENCYLTQEAEKLSGSINEMIHNEDFLRETNQKIEASLDYYKEKDQYQLRYIEDLEINFNKLKSEVHLLKINEQSFINKSEKLEQQLGDLKVQYERFKSDNKNKTESLHEYQAENARLLNKLDEAYENYSLLQSKFELLEQEMGILNAEKEEMSRRFFNNDISYHTKKDELSHCIETPSEFSHNREMLSPFSAHYSFSSPNSFGLRSKKNFGTSSRLSETSSKSFPT